MDEELQKRNTDCVYFLASPLTCKKGLECEYRHSEIVRLNPRDCWYWLAGSCLNPTCAFRHPPLDGCTEASSETAQPQHECSVPVNKTNVPCYFFFNGFCNKGDRCSFLHGPDDGTSALKSLKTGSAVTNALPLENKTLAGSDTGSAPIETHPNSCETAPKRVAEIQIKPTEDLHESAAEFVTDRSASPHVSASEYEEAAAVSSDSLLPAEGFVKDKSPIFMDQSSEEQMDDLIEREEWLESSPGFDVLVNNKSENLGYEDDLEYIVALDEEDRELSSHFPGFDYEDHVEYDPAYLDAGTLFERDICDTYGHLDDENTYGYVCKIPRRSGERMLDPILPGRRKFFPTDLATNSQRDMDLRDHLKKRRMIDGHLVTDLSRRHDSTRLTGRSREGRRQRAQRLHGRLALEAENRIIRSHVRSEILLNGVDKQGRFRETRINKSRQRSKEKRKAEQQFLSSEASRKQPLKKRRSIKESGVFEGPKTLAEIKEEKKKARENAYSYREMGDSSRTTLENFQGPKPLSEILKDKRGVGSVVE
ncbi:zinc finger CCCH domain-containing protein 34-like [Cornus florida]|uniref:zinc finger CCCH domain-containing protein 34-like n=1 Tax=Cornus florida TaxID=4283 RepID=UPI00289F6226|nr:zinc finger CCCH domain-containing protein 34-like [Cornus florida]